MVNEEELAGSVRAALKGAGAIREVRMFGGIGFMLNGNLVAAASRRGLLLRVGKDRQADALARSGDRPMVMRGRTMEGYVYVDPPVLSKPTVQDGLRMAVAYVQTLRAALPPPLRERVVEQAYFANEHRDAPSVRHDVMHRDQQRVVVVRSPKQRRPDQRQWRCLATEYGARAERADHFVVAHVNHPDVALCQGAIAGDWQNGVRVDGRHGGVDHFKVHPGIPQAQHCLEHAGQPESRSRISVRR